MPAENGQDFIKTGRSEYIKTHFVYDGSDRMVNVYEARANTPNGGYALKTTYSYVSTSTRIANMKEEESTWDSSWDI